MILAVRFLSFLLQCLPPAFIRALESWLGRQALKRGSMRLAMLKNNLKNAGYHDQLDAMTAAIFISYTRYYLEVLRFHPRH